MALIPEFLPPVAPDAEDFETTITARVRSVASNDKFSVRAADGRNNLEMTINLAWTMLTPAQASAIDAFFRERGGFHPFGFKVPGTSEMRKFVCTSWRKVVPHTKRGEIYAVFEEVFDLRAVDPAVDLLLTEDGETLLTEEGEELAV